VGVIQTNVNLLILLAVP